MITNCAKCGRSKEHHFGPLKNSAGCTSYKLVVKLPPLEKEVLMTLDEGRDLMITPESKTGTGYKGHVKAALERLHKKGFVHACGGSILRLTEIGTDVAKGLK
jgi:hypothetical protein